jgi:HEAT repeats/PBS lyase HEAT-like repeat
MGILDIFRTKPLPPGDPATQKAGQKLINRNADPAARYQAAETLANLGTEEAIFCLLQRFTVVIGTNIPDEDEKKFVLDKVLVFGKKAIPALIKHIREKEQIGQALDVMRKLCSEEEFLDQFLDIVQDYDPYHSKFPDRKIQSFQALAEYQDDRILEVLIPFLDDDDDDVRIAATEAIAAQENEEKVRPLLLQLIVDSEEQPRVRITACEAIARRQWKVAGFRKKIAAVLPDQFYMDSKGRIRLKSGYEF